MREITNQLINVEFAGLNANEGVYYDFTNNPYFKLPFNTLYVTNNSGCDVRVVINKTINFLVPSNTNLKIEKKDNIAIRNFEIINENTTLPIGSEDINILVGKYE